MIRRLIILLLIVGCEEPTEPEDEIKEVAWVLYKSSTNPSDRNWGYWVEGYEPTNNLNDNLNDEQFPPDEVTFVSFYFGVDSAGCVNESKRILHYTKLNYFEILDVIPNVLPITTADSDESEFYYYYCNGQIGNDESSININLYAEDNEIIQYEYK